MILNRITKTIIVLTVAVLLAAVAFYVYFFHFHLPGHLRREILPELLGDAGLTGFSGELHRVGALGADLGELIVGEKTSPSLHIGSVGIQYRLRDFLWTNQLSISDVNLRGVELKCRLQEDGLLLINGLALEDFLALPAKHFGAKRRLRIARLLADATINVRDGVLAFEAYKESFTAPFTLKIVPLDTEWSTLEATFKLRWQNRDVSGKVAFDSATGKAKIDIGGIMELAQALRLSGNLMQFELPVALQANGESEIAGQFNLQLNPLRFGNFSLQGTIGAGELRHDSLWIRNHMLPSGRKIPVTLDVSRKDARLAVRLENVFCHKPLPVMLKELNLEIPSDRLLPVMTSGKFAVDLTQFRILQHYGIQPAGDAGVEKKFSGRFNRADGEWHFDTTPKQGAGHPGTSESYVFSRDGMNFFCCLSNLEISGSGAGFAGELVFRGGINALNVVAERATFSGKGGDFQAGFKLSANQNGELSTGENTLSLYLPQLFYFSDEHRLTVNELRFGSGIISADNTPVAMQFELGCNEFVLRREQSSVSGHRLNIVSRLTKSPHDAMWSGQLKINSEAFDGRHDAVDCDLQDIRLKSSFTIARPSLELEALRTVNANINLTGGGYGTKNARLRIEGADFGLSMTFAPTGARLMDKAITGNADVISLSHGDNVLHLWKSKWFGSLKRGQSLDDVATDADFLERIDAEKIEFSTPSWKLIAGSGTFRLEGQLRPDRLFPARSRLSVDFPVLWALDADSKIRAEQVVAALTGRFADTLSIGNAIKDADFVLTSGQVSGNIGARKISADAIRSRVDVKTFPADTRPVGLGVEHLAGEGDVTRFIVADAAGSAEMSTLKVTCQAESDSDNRLRWHPSITGKQVSAVWNGYRGIIPEIRLHGRLDRDGFAGELSGDMGKLSCGNPELTLDRLDLNIPVVWPGRQIPLQGNLTVGEIGARQAKLGTAIVDLSNDGRELKFAGKVHSTLLPATPVFSGGIMLPFSPSRWHTSFAVPRHATLQPFYPGHHFPELDGIMFNGTAEIHGQLSGNEERVSGQMKFKLENSELHFRDWAVSGLSGVCQFNDPLRLQSEPRQRFSFRRLEHQGYGFENGVVNLQIEKPQTVYVENAEFGWLGGVLTSLSPFRVGEEQNEKEAVFQADNLQLEPLLALLRIGGTAPDTSLSGKLRVKITDGKLRVSSAELATETGTSGVLELPEISRFANPEQTDSPDAGNLEFVQDALTDFRYNWLRLQFDEVHNGLDVRLKTGGSPSNPIPFRFDAASGSFVRTFPGEAKFSGNVALESEFHLPREH